MVRDDGWSELFRMAFRQSRNAMTLVDEQRCHVDVNGAYLKLVGYRRDELVGRPIAALVVGGPQFSEHEWANALAARRFHGENELVCADGSRVAVQWGASVEVATGRRLVLVVALGTSRRGRRFAPAAAPPPLQTALSEREREIVRLVALGHTGPEIGTELQIAHDTVRTHVRNAMIKTATRSRAHLVAKALGDGLVLG